MASLVFDDAHCLIGPDRIDEAGEQRWHAIGAARIEAEAVVLLVVHAYRENLHGEEITRIILVRTADKHDLRRYQKQKMDCG